MSAKPGDQLGGRRHQLPAHSLDRGWVRVVDDELEHFVDARADFAVGEAFGRELHDLKLLR